MTLRFSVLILTYAAISCLSGSPVAAQVHPPDNQAHVWIAEERAPVAQTPVATSASATGSGATWWEQRYHPNHALGRAYLASLAPMALGTVLTGIGERNPGESPFQSPLYLAGLCVSGLGIAAGPSAGLWCTDAPRTAWLSAGVRTAGLGAVGVGFWRASTALDDVEGLEVLVAAPLLITVYTLPGLLITSAGVAWAFQATPNRWCEGTPQARATLQPHMDATGQGLALRVQW